VLVGAADGDVEAEFNKGFILPPLIVQLRKILDQYPDDTQILRVSTCIIDLLGSPKNQTCSSVDNKSTYLA